MMDVSISFGGSKLAAAIVESERIIIKTGRVEWRDHNDYEGDLESLLDISVTLVKECLERTNRYITDVGRVNIAWPGPGDYAKGMLTATFIPNCTNRPVHKMLLKTFRKKFGSDARHLRFFSRLDVNVRAQGEIRSQDGAFYTTEGGPKLDGIVLNIATGIAGAIIRNSIVLQEFGRLGITYGNFGRYLLLQTNSGKWVWRPTDDGSIPYHSIDEIRLTDRCGGPALTRRFVEKYHQSTGTQKLPADLESALKTFPVDKERDLKSEKALLIKITHHAYSRRGLAYSFIKEVGADIGGALRCLYNSIGEESFGGKLVLTGGIGEFFGKPLQPDQPDILIDSIQSIFEKPTVDIVRSTIGLDAELVGYAGQ